MSATSTQTPRAASSVRPAGVRPEASAPAATLVPSKEFDFTLAYALSGVGGTLLTSMLGFVFGLLIWWPYGGLIGALAGLLVGFFGLRRPRHKARAAEKADVEAREAVDELHAGALNLPAGGGRGR